MTRRKQVSEKSLELNICSEILQCVRRWPGCQKALWVGFTQAQESQTGMDELLGSLGVGILIMLQFKAPWGISVEDRYYRFSVTERQHSTLNLFARQCPGAVYYVFPLYCTWKKADRHAPELIQDTWLVPPSLVTPLAPSLTSLSHRHPIEIERSGSSRVVTTSWRGISGKPTNAKGYFCKGSLARSLDAQQIGFPVGEFREWLDRWNSQDLNLRYAGLDALFIPT